MQFHYAENTYSVPIGRGALVSTGEDVTIVAVSYMVKLARESARILADEGISAEVVDVRSLKPLDEDLICSSVCKTGRLVVADGGWRTAGAGAEIAAMVGERAFDRLKAPIRRVTLPDVPAPSSRSLESSYYPSEDGIVQAARTLFSDVDSCCCGAQHSANWR